MRPAIIHPYYNLSLLLQFLSLWREGVECSGRRVNGNPKGDNVPLRDNRSDTHGKLYLRDDQLSLMYPPFLNSTLISKKATPIFWKGYQAHHQSMVSQFAIQTSAGKLLSTTLLSSQLRSKLFQTLVRFSSPLLCRLCFCVLQCNSGECLMWKCDNGECQILELARIHQQLSHECYRT